MPSPRSPAGSWRRWACTASSRAGGRTETVTLVLTGIAVNALAGALIGLLMFPRRDAELRSITFWSLGSLGNGDVGEGRRRRCRWWWWASGRAALRAAAGPAGAGRAAGRHLGVDVERLRRRLVVVVALLTAAAVAVAGSSASSGWWCRTSCGWSPAPATAVLVAGQRAGRRAGAGARRPGRAHGRGTGRGAPRGADGPHRARRSSSAAAAPDPRGAKEGGRDRDRLTAVCTCR